MAHDLGHPAYYLLHPICSFIYSCVARIQPQLREARGRRSDEEGSSKSLMPSLSTTLASWTLTLSTNPCVVSTNRCRLRPLTFLAPSYARSFPPTPVVLIDWLSTIAALG